MNKRSRGITLIALTITIIVLLILAAVSLNFVLGENGIIAKAKEAKYETEKESLLEAIRMKATEKEFEKEYEEYDYVDYLKEKGVVDYSNGKVNMAKLNIKISTGYGSWSKGDLYQVVGNKLYYFDKNDNKMLVGELWDDYNYLLFSYDTGEITGVKKDADGNFAGPGKVVIPEKIKQVQVKGIHSGAFSNVKNIQSITIIPKIDKIPEYCFNECVDLEEVNLPSSVQTIEEGAFRRTAIKEVTIPNNVTTIGVKLFAECSNLQKVSIENEMIDLPEGTFYNCTSLKEVKLPESLKSIGYQSFFKCHLLENITFPTQLQTIDERAFYKCIKLNQLSIPTSVENIKSQAFAHCDSLTQVELQGTPVIAADAFEHSPYQP